MKNSAWIIVPYAHSLAGQGPESWEPLERHGQEVARMAAGFAAAFHSAQWAELAGELHDTGKARASFRDTP